MGTNQRSQITMTDDEVDVFLEQSRTVTMATNGPKGRPHLIAMWYAYFDGKIWFETKAKSQKVQNLRRDDAISCMVEDGKTYDQLRGVALEGRAVILDDPESIWAVGINVFERYTGPYTEAMKPYVEAMMNKRIVVRVDVERVRSWDHRKLGMGAMPLGGTTAQYL
jgi:PPOX class probable F420-dependent enzyme